MKNDTVTLYFLTRILRHDVIVDWTNFFQFL